MGTWSVGNNYLPNIDRPHSTSSAAITPRWMWKAKENADTPSDWDEAQKEELDEQRFQASIAVRTKRRTIKPTFKVVQIKP